MAERRRQYFTDQKLQGYLLAALIAIEVMLVGVLLLVLYADVNAIIEQQIYRIHGIEDDSWPQIFRLVAVSMSLFLVVNIVILYLAHSVWSRYIKATIIEFSSVLDQIIQHDFQTPLSSVSVSHQMMEMVRQWFKKEQRRNTEIDEMLEQLSGCEDRELNANERERLKAILQRYRQVLTTQGS
jgi:hypothetical protein